MFIISRHVEMIICVNKRNLTANFRNCGFQYLSVIIYIVADRIQMDPHSIRPLDPEEASECRFRIPLLKKSLQKKDEIYCWVSFNCVVHPDFDPAGS